MSALSSQLREAGSVVGAVDAVNNFKALAIDLFGALVAVLVFGLFLAMAGNKMNFALPTIGFLLGVIIFLVTWNAAGVVLMDQVAGGAMRSVIDALVAGALATLKGIALFILAFLGVLIVAAIVAALLFVCKIPGLGPLLFAVVFPLCVVVMGVLLAAFLFLLIPVAAPAIWSGESISGSLARILVVARQRLLGVLVRNIALIALILIAGLLLSGILSMGTATTGAMSAGILQDKVDPSSMGSMFGGGYGRGMGRSGDGYVIAGMLGGSLLVLIAWVLPFLMLKKGWCLIYRDLVQDVDTSAVEAQMQKRMEQVKQKANATRERVQQQNMVTRASTGGAVQTPAGEMRSEPGVVGTSSAAACPSCKGAIQAGDVFCGNCGFKLN